MVNTSMTHEFKHPKYYTELRKRNKSDQAISKPDNREVVDSVRPGPGHKQRDSQVVNQVKLSSQSQASSSKPQASSSKLIKKQATSFKPQATSVKIQATGFKLQDS